MSLIVKGISLPQSCSTCRFSYFTVGIKKRCEISGDEVNPLIDHRDINCPLSEIPTLHGRLIDADRLYNEAKNTYCDKNCDKGVQGEICDHCGVPKALNVILNAPTVIEAEVSE